MSISAWQKIAKPKNELENQIKNINNLIISSKLSDELGQIKYEKLLKPVTSRLDTQIELTKGLKDENEMPNFEPPEPIYEGEDEMPNFEPPEPIYEGEDEMPNFEPSPPIDDDDDEMPKRKKWDPSPFNIANQKELDNERKDLAKERRYVNVLLGKLLKSGNTQIKSGVYQGASYEELLKKSDELTKQINRIEDQLLMTSQKKQRMEYKKVPFSSSELQEKSKKLKRTPSKTKSKTKPIIEKSLLSKIESMRKGTKPDSDIEENEWEGSGLNQNYKAIYYNI